MIHVVAMGGDLAGFTGGLAEFDLPAANVRELIRELETRWPGAGDYVARRMAVAIDGVIHQDADQADLATAHEICLIPRIGGG